MKISTTWNIKDWQHALTKVFKLAENFEEIITYALENNLMTPSDIINAAQMYEDPEKLDNLDDDQIKAFIKSRGLSDIMTLIKDEYGLEDILYELPEDDVLNHYDNDVLLDHLEGSFALEDHDSEVRSTFEYYLKEEILEDIGKQNRNNLNKLNELNGDDLHRFICNVIGCGYYDQERLNEGLQKMKDKLNTNNYNIKYE